MVKIKPDDLTNPVKYQYHIHINIEEAQYETGNGQRYISAIHYSRREKMRCLPV